jgi:hypothetical protein
MEPLKVITNQLGYRNGHGKKRVLVSDVPEARGIFGDAIFTVFEQNDFSKYALNDPRQLPHTHRASLKRIRTDFGPWLVGDFSHLQANGVYQAFCGNEPGPSFAIRDDVWCRILPECLRYFQVQSCGRNVPGWHEACHLDDGYIRELDRYLPAAGGWHDAGDFRKWATSTALNAIALLVGDRLWAGREAELGVEPGVFLREALQGVHYFLGIQDETTGALFKNIGGGRDVPHDNLDCRYTDNVPRSGDERRIWQGWAQPAAKFTTLFALYANALKTSDPQLAARCAAAACASLRFDLTTNHQTADALQWRAWGYLELWRQSGAAVDQAAAIATLDQLLALQVTDYIGGQKLTRGFFRRGAGQDDFHRKHVGASYPIWVIAEFLDAWPAHAEAGRWRDAIALWVDEYALVFAARNPFGLLPYGLYTSPTAEHPHHHYRPLGDGLCFRYFTAGPKFGTNARCSLDAAAFAAAARVLNRPELLDNGYRLLEWTLGNNPFQLSTMNGVGVTQPSALSFQMGNIPGGVTMGIFGDEQDQPFYPHPWACTDEYYGYQTSHFTWALLALQTMQPTTANQYSEQ